MNLRKDHYQILTINAREVRMANTMHRQPDTERQNDGGVLPALNGVAHLNWWNVLPFTESSFVFGFFVFGTWTF